MSASLDSWIGNTQRQVERLEPARASALQAALGDEPSLGEGDRLPPLFHWLYFWDPVTPEQTGNDGHPRRGRFMPPIVAPRRMWASGKVRFQDSLRLGDDVEKQSRIASVSEKDGRSGPLTFVTIDHKFSVKGVVAIEEQQTIVYRGGGSQSARPVGGTSPPPGDFTDSIYPDPVLLFRYSALTLNSHRIHYDRSYAVDEEGYKGLVVQGPLQATILARSAVKLCKAPLDAFEFKGIAPAFDGATIEVNAYEQPVGTDLVATQSGRTTMTATAIVGQRSRN